MSTIGTLTITYSSGPPKTYQMVRPSTGKAYFAALKGTNWGASDERLVYTADPQTEKIYEMFFEVTVGDFNENVGVVIDDAVRRDSNLDLYSEYQLPAKDGDESDHKLSTKSTPGWTLRVKVKKKISS